jgi:transposase
MPTDFLDIRSAPVAHLPVLRALIDRLGIHAILDDLLPKHPLPRVSDADCVVTMILNILCGRVALFRMDEWLGRTDVELLLGPGRDADAFDDNRLAAALDHVDALGTDDVLTAVVQRFLAQPGRETTYSVHQDFTTISLHGAYEYVPSFGPVPAYGHSKELRPDLKQLVFGLTIHGSAGVPLVCSTLDGNTSDARANRDHLLKLTALLPDEDDVTVVADCKLVDGQTLGQLLCAGFHFVSLLPDSFNLRAELVNDAWTADPDVSTWPVLGTHPGRKKADPHTFYRGRSVERVLPMLLHKSPCTASPGPHPAVPSDEVMRFLLVHSGSLEAAFDAHLPKRLKEEKAAVEAATRRANRTPSLCKQEALAAGQKCMPKLRFHSLQLSVSSVERPVPRTGRGRPKRGEEIPVETVWLLSAELALDETAVQAKRQHASCFPLVTDHLHESGWTDERILAEYRHQGIVEGNTGFRWLKGPAAVAPMFLKTPTRMRALGLVMVLALMVRNYWQFAMRREAKNADEKIVHPFTKRPVTNLTAEMAMEHFGGMQAVLVQLPDQRWARRPRTLSDTAVQILRLLHVSPHVFHTPPRQKIEIRTI